MPQPSLAPAYIVVCSQIYTTDLTDLEQVKNRSTEVLYTHAETASQRPRAAHTGAISSAQQRACAVLVNCSKGVTQSGGEMV